MLSNKKECTNCLACLNSCPNNAILIKKDEFGFSYPKIDEEKCLHCGLCVKTCGKIQKLEKNKKVICAYLAQSKNWNLSKKSASGGIFAQLASYILENGGIVFGCSLEFKNNSFKVKHISVDDKKYLYKLQGSKYVQSDIGHTFKEAKEYLDNKRLVLYSGTPCQIAGLKGFLKKEYNNLLCVDISCEGVPSLQMFNDYIKHLEKERINKTIVDYKFRDKENNGWSCGNSVAYYKDKGEIKKEVIDQKDSIYMSLFLEMQILRESCYNCRYSGIQRVSDITIADAWGIDSEYPELLKGKLEKREGISFIILNSPKGQMYFRNIEENIKKYEVNPDKMRKYNHPLCYPSILEEKRNYYLEIYKNKGFLALEKAYLKDKDKNEADCLLMTMYANPNYGSILTAFALQKALKDLGYSSEIINYGELLPYSESFYKKYCKLTNKVASIGDFCKLQSKTSTFILGSDNLMNCETGKLAIVARNLFNFTKLNKKRIVLGGSMGNWNGEFKNKNNARYFKKIIRRLDYISVREKQAKAVIEKQFNCKADWLNDPVFYINKQTYMDIAKSSIMDYSNSVMKYILYPTKQKEQVVDFVSKQQNLKIETFEGNENAGKKYINYQDGILVQDWLNAIINSKIIITDSFHCVAFALMFNKKVICLKNEKAPVRFLSLFEKLGVKIPIVNSIEELKQIDFEYDINKVNQEMAKIREFALVKIKEAMESPKEKLKVKLCLDELEVCGYNCLAKLRNFAKSIFSVTNIQEKSGKRKIVKLFGIKIKLKLKRMQNAIQL